MEYVLQSPELQKDFEDATRYLYRRNYFNERSGCFEIPVKEVDWYTLEVIISLLMTSRYMIIGIKTDKYYLKQIKGYNRYGVSRTSRVAEWLGVMPEGFNEDCEIDAILFLKNETFKEFLEKAESGDYKLVFGSMRYGVLGFYEAKEV